LYVLSRSTSKNTSLTIVSGVTNAFGVFEAYYTSGYLHSDDANISIIGAIQTIFSLASAGIVGPLHDHGYFYHLIWTGSLLSCFGMMMTSLCKTYYQVLLAQGNCVGLGSGCIFAPTMAVLSTYFSSHKNLAVGIAATGSSIGGIIYPITFYYLLPQIGYAWSVRVIGFLMMATCAIILSVLRVRMATLKGKKSSIRQSSPTAPLCSSH
jgi:MFS family permease